MAFKFVLMGCFLALHLSYASFIHHGTSMSSHYGPSTAQYISQDLHYPNTGSNPQGSSSQPESNAVGPRGGNGQNQLNSSQHQTVQITPGSYSPLANHLQGKSDVRVTNPGTYSVGGNYNGPSRDGQPQDHRGQINFASTPSYSNINNNNNNGGYQHPASSPHAYRPVYEHRENPGTVYTHHALPVYQYVTSAYALPAGSSFHHNGNDYSQQGTAGSSSLVSSSSSSSPSSSSPGGHIIGVPYSPAVAVSHMSYSSPVGISYAW